MPDAPKQIPNSTVGRSRKKSIIEEGLTIDTSPYADAHANIAFGDSLTHYDDWETPTCIVSDGAYGILGFEGDTYGEEGIAEWYEPHIKRWTERATAQTSLWFWNSEIGWAAVHPLLKHYGWDYVNCNVWDKGRAHIAGNVNTATIRRFPVVSEVCVHYVKRAEINELSLRDWLRSEWKRTKLPFSKANEACGVKDAAVRKYLDKGHLWYFPPPEMFEKMATYANIRGEEAGKPYFSADGVRAMTAGEWGMMRAKFTCPHGYTNVWNRKPLKGKEREAFRGKAAHLNQKPLDLFSMIIEATTNEEDVVWEPFGGTFTGVIAARRLRRRAYSAEISEEYYTLGRARVEREATQVPQALL